MQRCAQRTSKVRRIVVQHSLQRRRVDDAIIFHRLLHSAAAHAASEVIDTHIVRRKVGVTCGLI